MCFPPTPTRLDRYIFRQLFWALIAVTAGLAALIWLKQSRRFVELVVNRGLSLLVFMRLTGLLIPSFIAVILPITTYAVIQFIYQRLAGDREVTVMRAAGLSPFSLARPPLAVAFRTRSTDGSLHGILVDDARDPAVHATILAESGQLMEGTNGPRVLLLNGSRQEIDRQTGRLNMLTFTENELDLADATSSGGERPADMSEVSIGELLNPRLALPRDVPKWIAEAQKRLGGPLASISYAFVALVSVLTGTLQRHASFVRPLVSVVVVVLPVALGLTIDGLAARDDALIWTRSVLPAVVCAVVLFVPIRWTGRAPAPPEAGSGASVGAAAA